MGSLLVLLLQGYTFNIVETEEEEETMVNHTKRVIGSYESELEAIQAVEKLKADGYRAEDRR
ncbi:MULTISPECIES: hypothetical protein [Bacillus]|uniref:hypothetical protein n=1 Tax=Bacillus TaxID=1386 RepID=UPI000C77DB65|nr:MULTISPECIES: hypothetical protein [Bacillus]PLR87405.1 hypothetical protein CVD23_02845 [Bacillus sp. V33-4]RSK50591.1 hypothetical protein EJA13_14675 [Bacillus canaveralius]